MSDPALTSPHATQADEPARLSGVPILDALPEGPRGRLLPHVTQLEFGAGVTFLREDEATEFLAIVVSGRLSVHMRVPERGAITILTLEPGDIVGWSAIVAPFRATTSATTLEPTELAVIDAAALRSLLGADVELAAALYPRLLDTLAARLAATRVQLLDLFQARETDPW